MICVILGRGRHSALLEEWRLAAKQGAELIEIRADILRREVEVKRLLDGRPTPAVFTIRRGRDGGVWRHDEEKRLRLIREAIVHGVEYVDIEEDIAGSIPRFGKTKRIVSYHNFKETPRDLPEIIERLRKLDADVVKIATIANSLDDSITMLQVAKEASRKVPLIAMTMGELGFFTRILGTRHGAPFIYAGFNPERIFAPGIPLFRDLRRDYHYDEIRADSELYAVIGDPIGHSLSPAVHNNVFRALGLNKAYVPLKIPAADLPTFFERFDFLKLRGLSVTIPHKETIIPLLHEVDDTVKLTGSCNTVIIREDGRRIGYNTDYPAAVEAMEEALGGRSEGGVSPLQGKQAIVLGAGGVARSVAFGLDRHGAGVSICNRNEERASKLAAEIGCKAIPWVTRASLACDAIVNCTPIGMHPDVDESPAPPAAFRPGMLAFDTVYHPENTMFLKTARSHDCKIATGVDMFVIQAAMQAKLFTGTEPPRELIREVVKRKFSPVQD